MTKLVDKNDVEILVINLDKDTDRLNKITKNLSPNTFTRIPGVYGKETDFTSYTNIFWLSHYIAPKSALGNSMSHKRAMNYFLQQSEKEYALILEDDAVPMNNNYMEEVVEAIQNAPSNWEIIKLDYVPNFNLNNYNRLPSLILTAYIINRKGAEKKVNDLTIYHIDIEWAFFNEHIYNNPKIVFHQIWDEYNHSNNRTPKSYNPFSKLHTVTNFNAFRIGNIDITWADIFLLVFLIFIFILFRLYFPDVFTGICLFLRKRISEIG